MRESDIIYESGDYWICRAKFGTGRFKPKSDGFQVYRAGVTHSTLCATIGHAGDAGLQRAIAEIERRKAADTESSNAP